MKKILIVGWMCSYLFLVNGSLAMDNRIHKQEIIEYKDEMIVVENIIDIDYLKENFPQYSSCNWYFNDLENINEEAISLEKNWIDLKISLNRSGLWFTTIERSRQMIYKEQEIDDSVYQNYLLWIKTLQDYFDCIQGKLEKDESNPQKELDKLDEINGYFEEWLIYYDKSDYRNAIRLFEKYLDHYPNDENAKTNIALSNQNLGSYYIKKEDYKEAIIYLKKALKYNKTDARTYGMLWLAYDYENNLNSALKYYKKALELESDSKIIKSILDNIEIIKKKKEEINLEAKEKLLAKEERLAEKQKKAEKRAEAENVKKKIINNSSKWPFQDITSYKYKNSVNFLQENNIVGGYNDNTFKPNNKITRAEFLKIILESNKIDLEEFINDKCFEDSFVSAWYNKYLCYAKDQGIINGFAGNLFLPDNNITYVEALKILYKSFGDSGDTSKKDKWYSPFLEDVKKKEIHLSELSESKELTRWEMGELMYRFLDKKKLMEKKGFKF